MGPMRGSALVEVASSPRIRAAGLGISEEESAAGAATPLPAPGRVMRAIAERRAAQRQRAEDYRRLGTLVAFIALLLGVLYAQRGAADAFRVHATIRSVLALPESGTMQSADEVYAWLGGLLEAVWKDPICGDGLCEAPFEFASYGRFGCRADCGALIDLQRLAAIDIDLYYDFGHPAGSLPAAELAAQAAWNLCPRATAFAAGCYYAEDAAFAGVSGEVHITLRDVPDGAWALRVKRDPLAKVRGAVRLTDGVQRAAAVAKVYVAAAAVAAEQAQELALLRLAIAAGRTPLLDYLPTLWNVTARAAARDAFDAQQLRNATCVCGPGATAALAGTAGFVDEATYQAGGNCTGVTELAQRVWYPNGTSATTMPPSIDAAVCAEALANLTAHRSALNATMLSWLVTQRLGNLATTGKFASRTSTISRLRAFLAARRPELVAPIFTQPKGAGGGAQAAPQNATVAELAALYVDAPSLAAGGPPAHLALFRRRLNGDPGMTFAAWADRAAARVAEIAAQQAEVANLILPIPGAPPATTVGAVARAFQAAGANATWLPAPDAPELGALAVRYDLAAWAGGPWEFATCQLSQRAPEYAGTCEARTVACGASAADGVPYACMRLADNATVPGNLSSSAYRAECELPCDLEADCGALCDCGAGGCAAGQFCKCAACVALQGDAAANSEFVTIATAAASSGAAASTFAPVAAAAGAGGRRRLRATSNDEVAAQLSALSTKLDTLRAVQDAVGGQVDALQRRVDQANALAEARAASTRVPDLIAAGRADIAAGRAALEGKLDSLLGRQQAVLDAARTASAALAAIESMAARQASALAGLDAAVKEQVRTISVATQQGLISLSTALAYWKSARRGRAAEERLYRLANAPCRGDAAVDHEFAVDNGAAAASGTARDRSVGLNNRIIGGVLLHTWRAAREECPKTRFSAITSSCRARRAPDLRPYGVDAAFKPGTASFQADLAAPDDGPALSLYNCSRVAPGPAAYDVVDAATGLTTNRRPYCAQLFNARNVPYGFHHFPLPGARAPGFPVWLDINLPQEGAATWLAWLRDGLLLDGATAGLTATFATYNADMRLWALVEAAFDFGDGLVEVAARVAPLRVELYDPQSRADAARFAAEVALSAASCLMALAQLWTIAAAALGRAPGGGGLARYFASPAHWVDALSNALQLACCALWWLFALRHARAWSMALRYDVYADLAPAANFLRLADGGRALLAAWDALRGLGAASRLLAWYFAASGASVLLLLARLLRRVDFQPRLGVITRALRRALPDLLHFALVAGAVFVGYGVTGFLVFGSAVPQFAGLGASLNACFDMVLGDFGGVRAALAQLRGVQGAAGGLFFWTYMLLVFLVLLNFLLAIIVDAFAEVKETTRESTGLITELAQLAADAWRGLAGRLLPGSRARAAQRKLDALLEGLARPANGDSGDYDGSPPGDSAPRSRRTGARAALAVDGQLLDERALAAALCAALTPFDAAGSGGEKGNLKGSGGMLSTSAAGAGGISAEDAAAVARYALQRYGTAAAAAAEAAAGASGETDGEGGGGARGGIATTAAAAQGAGDERGLAGALERLAAAQRDLAQAQRALLAGQRALADQQRQLADGGGI